MSPSQSGTLLPMRSLGRFPSGPRVPLGASVTLWEATAPVKLPIRRCPQPRGRLGPRRAQSGISPPPPYSPQAIAPRVPPILRSTPPGPTPNYSKAPRGLFVLVEQGRIFTANAISPSECSRQLFARDAIRAGRNLPDKELRYRRTVIVTAAVYWSFSSEHSD